ncbi:GGDEF domain-containing protein [Paenibacillus chitinolyticus]|uniref:EAL domain-containing protein n=1 Tax=Paenibacillus chitinolyticus TaxID=79263 RepID=A0A410WTD0_9BACL|nr:EAL domain-containing protein [Paenibacillus chitinolyticus]MCY9588653.1 EAL domain-containing protein [Paenibacillus chitinolyticus]MCY9595843.1 EAL domain-containing protein [Paenibacillus chitinolyticus]QAV17594.1 GGDEF domain-containing protein [Paenibacillus chitinolyticus]
MIPVLLGGYAAVIVIGSVLLRAYAVWICLGASAVLAGALYTLNKRGNLAASGQEGLPALDNKPADPPIADETSRLLDTLFDYSPNAISVTDEHGKLTRVSRTMERLLGATNEQLIGNSFGAYVSDEHKDKLKQRYGDLRTGTPQLFDIPVLHRSGYRIDLSATGVPLETEGANRRFLFMFQDITERRRADEQFRHMAYYDDMTGLPNRRLFKEQLTETLHLAESHHQRVAVMYVDIDGFKLFNDCFGYDYGDMLLLQVAERFTRCVSDNDFIARTEGDEFAFFYTGIQGREQALQLASRLLSVLEEPFMLEQYELHVTASIGISLLSREHEDADTLMKHANMAVTRAKENGKSDIQIFNSEMRSVSLQKLQLENDLRRAITNNEFVLHYQPQVEIESGQIVGMEALIRWNHPQKGFIPPGDFIPFAEQSGLIVPISEWVLHEACQQNQAWQDAGLPKVPVSVNLSSRQFLQHNLKAKVDQVLQHTGLAPQFLELEITESMTMDVEHAIASLLELKQLGVQVSIDDFGTGYSSLSYLKRFPVDRLKIDRSFVRDIMEDPSDAAIVATIISMTRHLNLKVIAEGVETEEQLSFLHRNQCHEVQGYWFSPPLTADKMGSMLRRITCSAGRLKEA